MRNNKMKGSRVIAFILMICIVMSNISFGIFAAENEMHEEVYGSDNSVEKSTHLTIDSIESSAGTEFVEGVETIFNVKTSNNTGEVLYKFSYVNNTTGQSGTLRDYMKYNVLSWMFGTAGEYTLIVSAKDDNITVSKTFAFEVKEYRNLQITSVVSSLGDTFKLGGTTYISVNTTGGKGINYYAVKVNGEYISYESSSNTVAWTPTQAGTYTIVGYARERQGIYISFTKTIQVEEKAENLITIYYRGFNNPYIHYGINGTWTSVPGIRMEACADVEGYFYKAEIDLGKYTSAEVCFNDGNGNWDSNYGSNYIFGIGVYTYSDGVITKIG